MVKDAPIDFIGLQCHMRAGFDGQIVMERLDRLGPDENFNLNKKMRTNQKSYKILALIQVL